MRTFTFYGLKDGEAVAPEPLEAASPMEARKQAEQRLAEFDLVVVCSPGGLMVRVKPQG